MIGRIVLIWPLLYVPFVMPQDFSYIVNLYEALQSGGLGTHPPEQERYALEQYTTLAGQWLDQDLRAMDEVQIRVFNDDVDYPCWFATYAHTCGKQTTNYLMVHVKDSWYRVYLQLEQEWKQLSPEEQAQRDPREAFTTLTNYIKQVQNIRQQAPKN